MHRVAFSVDDIDEALEIAARHGCHPLRGVATYGDVYKLTYVRGPSAFSDVDVQGAAVLLRTGWDRHWGTDRYGDPVHPHLTEAGARTLVDRGAALVGIDSVNIDDTTTGQRPAHTVLLAAGILVVEHLTGLDGLPATGATFTAVPPAIRGLATFPVRAFASVP